MTLNTIFSAVTKEVESWYYRLWAQLVNCYIMWVSANQEDCPFDSRIGVHMQKWQAFKVRINMLLSDHVNPHNCVDYWT